VINHVETWIHNINAEENLFYKSSQQIKSTKVSLQYLIHWDFEGDFSNLIKDTCLEFVWRNRRKNEILVVKPSNVLLDSNPIPVEHGSTRYHFEILLQV
jgi:hypothetical protein